MFTGFDLRTYLVLVILAALPLLAGCNSSDLGNQSADTAGAGVREVTLDARDDRDRIELQSGQILVITLPSNPSTGFQWQVVEADEDILQQRGEAEFVVSDPRDPPPPGTGGAETFRFEAVGAGQTALELVYHRAWEEGVDPLETFSVQVVVR